MDAPTFRQQLLQALPELFPGDENTDFRGDAAVAIDKMSADWSAGLLGMPVGDQKAAIKAAVRGGRGTEIYSNVILTIIGKEDETVMPFKRVNRGQLERVLDRHGCDLVLDPVDGELTSIVGVELHDNLVMTALQGLPPWEQRMSTVEGFVLSPGRSLEESATKKVVELMRRQHPEAVAAEIRVISSADGQQREVDGVVIADECAAIVEAKQQLTEEAVPQLESCLRFIR
ncbi:hypothetical protein MNEG_0951 [Monoraphidium neglectum]|uniref:Uncharacterized protein n=1 Tax=Monoraphidium neglectum TaxID=145388 RepID=A0A0D2NRU3_9CHLO|nr:hypothetical protein MNEG_0951 [Monoraphidium neglectum]KIZ07006.1 hypothetical protein MNEG_0951 [Monoraphidium neglectum]|eukprot:XP_013906025.1 hypothetical protein MNEG_0951 [Monoraphidium neglectum]